MISDILSEAQHQITEYLDNFPDVYKDRKIMIDALLLHMIYVRMELDKSPSQTQ